MYQEAGIFQTEKNKNESESQINRDKYLVILDKIIKKRTFGEFNTLRTEHLVIERKVKEISRAEECLARLLKIYGINDLEFKKIAQDLYEIKLNSAEGYDQLDSEYAYKGGAARSILARELGFITELDFRDIDLLRTVERDFNEEDEKMALKYSPEDLRNGHGIEQLREDYFETRDFTINELLVVNDRIILSTACLLDTARGIIRFSDYEKRDYLESNNTQPNTKEVDRSYLKKYQDEKNTNKTKFFINDKLMAKALRFCVIQSMKRPVKLMDEEVYEYLDINNFHIALHLDRALEEGVDVARAYIKKLIELGQLRANIINEPKDILKEFIEMTQEEGSFIFRAESLAVINSESKSDLLNELARSVRRKKHINDIEEYL